MIGMEDTFKFEQLDSSRSLLLKKRPLADFVLNPKRTRHSDTATQPGTVYLRWAGQRHSGTLFMIFCVTFAQE